ncbi:MAG: hypothetical protein JXQ99_29665 [Hyphomicrobiaceae bacterium]
MNAIAGDPVRVRATASMILAEMAGELAEGSEKFLTDLATYDGKKRISVRALEYLYGLREHAWRRAKVAGWRADALIAKTWEARFDLVDYDAEEWLDELKEQGAGIALSKPQWRRLIAMAKQVDLIAAEQWIELK